MDEIKEIIMQLKLTEQKYKILIEYIKSEAEEICFDRNKILNFINILENKRGKEDEEK